MVTIREVEMTDAQAIRTLLEQLGYFQSIVLIEKKIEQFKQDQDQFLFIAELQQQIVGFLSLSMIPQIATEGDFARIAYLCVDEKCRGQKIGQVLLNHAEDIAKQGGCDRMELHSSDHRKQAHQFYLRWGMRMRLNILGSC